MKTSTSSLIAILCATMAVHGAPIGLSLEARGPPEYSPANTPSNPAAGNKNFDPNSYNHGTTGPYAAAGAAAANNPAKNDPNFNPESNDHGRSGIYAAAGAAAAAAREQSQHDAQSEQSKANQAEQNIKQASYQQSKQYGGKGW